MCAWRGAAIPGLSANTTLSELNLNGCRIGDAGGTGFAEMLKTNSTLRTLKLANNQIAADGLLQLGEVLRDVNTTLSTLRLLGNNIDAQMAVKVAEMLSDNTTLTGLFIVDALQIGTQTGTIKQLCTRYRSAMRDAPRATRHLTRQTRRKAVDALVAVRAWITAGVCFAWLPAGATPQVPGHHQAAGDSRVARM